LRLITVRARTYLNLSVEIMINDYILIEIPEEEKKNNYGEDEPMSGKTDNQSKEFFLSLTRAYCSRLWLETNFL